MLRLGRDRHDASGHILAALDLGSARIGCLIARTEPQRGLDSKSFKVIAIAQQQSRGVQGGVVVDLPAAQDAVRTVVAEAEALARLHIDSVHVAVNCGQPRSTTFSGRVELPERIVRSRDIAVLDLGAREFAERNGRALIALKRLGYRLDDVRAQEAPLGLAGQTLHMDHVAVTAASDPLRNLEQLIHGCHLRIASRVVAAHASALAATTEVERRLGVTCVDIGGEVSTIAGYADGHLLFCSSVPVGGQHATLDLARAFGIPLAEAERIKALYGSLVLAASDAHDHVTLPGSGSAEARAQHVPKSVICQILRQRMHGLLVQVGEQIVASGASHLVGSRLVISGGSCQLQGLADFAAAELERPVRIGFPSALPGLAAGMASASFSCLVGVVLASLEPGERHPSPALPGGADQGYAGRVEQWLRETF